MDKDIEAMTSLERLTYLMQHKKIVLENLDRLKNMQGHVETSGPGKTLKCDSIELRTDFGEHCVVRSYFDAPLVGKIIDIAIAYYQERLSTIDMLIGLADEALQREIGPQLLDLLNKIADIQRGV